LQEGEQAFQPVPYDRDTILFLYILDGLPLCAIEQVAQFREAYERLQRDPHTAMASYHLHKDATRFPEITSVSREDALAEVALMRAVLQATIIGVIRWNPTAATFVFRHVDRSGVIDQEQIVDCGASLGRILATFQLRRELREPLNRARESWLQDQLHHPDGLWRLLRYRLVLSYYARFIFSWRTGTLEGGESVPPSEHLVVQALIADADNVVRHHENFSAQAVADFIGQWKHWLETFTDLAGEARQQVVVLAEAVDTGARALAVLRFHNRSVLRRSELEMARLKPMNPIDEDATPSNDWVAHWLGAVRPAAVPVATAAPAAPPAPRVAAVLPPAPAVFVAPTPPVAPALPVAPAPRVSSVPPPAPTPTAGPWTTVADSPAAPSLPPQVPATTVVPTPPGLPSAVPAVAAPPPVAPWPAVVPTPAQSVQPPASSMGDDAGLDAQRDASAAWALPVDETQEPPDEAEPDLFAAL
jgi:hypothetical protein